MRTRVVEMMHVGKISNSYPGEESNKSTVVITLFILSRDLSAAIFSRELEEKNIQQLSKMLPFQGLHLASSID